MKKLKDLWECHGRYFRCKIEDEECEGRICIEDDEIYLCQDIVDGRDSEEKFGYDYSWNITRSSETYLGMLLMKMMFLNLYCLIMIQ